MSNFELADLIIFCDDQILCVSLCLLCALRGYVLTAESHREIHREHGDKILFVPQNCFYTFDTVPLTPPK